MPAPQPRCQVVPLPDLKASFQIDGRERTCWHYSPLAPRPFLFPFLAPEGDHLTRMGHPGAPNHDHHRSIWFAHNKLMGVDCWNEVGPGRVRQREWLAYTDGDDEAVAAVVLEWFDGHDPQPLITQQLVIAVRPAPNDSCEIELQSTFTPVAESLELGKTNFGWLGVRVAKSISAHFGGGQLTDSEGRVGEPAIFGKNARWMDYSGPVSAERDAGIAYIDHPKNPRYPTHWHVRSDGWMGASFCLADAWLLKKSEPLTLRYLLWGHGGALNVDAVERQAAAFAARPAFTVAQKKQSHVRWTLERAAT